MKPEKHNQEHKGSKDLKGSSGQVSQPPMSQEERDQRIKNEPDTERLRSERQSVIDGENNRRSKP